MIRFVDLRTWSCAVALTMTVFGCGDDEPAGTAGTAGDAGTDAGETGQPMLPMGCNHFVQPGADDQEAVQAAFIMAQPGEVVCLDAGTFSFTRQVSLDQDQVTVRGMGAEATMLDFSGQISGGNGVLITGNDVTFEDLRVQNTPGDGIRADTVSNITFRRVHAWWDADESLDNGAYGLYPVVATGVTIEDCLVKGARDAGVYVGQSTNVLVSGCEAFGNVAGIEIENTTGAIVRDNNAHDNTAGILVFNLPGLDVKDGKEANVFANQITNNNLANFAEEGTIVALVPPGLGVLVLAADRNEFHSNTIAGNDSAGVAIIPYVSGLFGDPNDAEFDTFSEGNWVHDNTMMNNGQNPDDLIVSLNGMMNPSPDIIFGGCVDAMKDNSDGSLSNCVSDNGTATYVDANMCAQNMGNSTDISTVTCTHTPLPTD